MSQTYDYHITPESRAVFHNNADYCVGTGRLGLGLHAEYQRQLAMAQREVSFRYLRGHGLFNRDLSILCTYRDKDGSVRHEYNFTYLDRLYDMYVEQHIKPFIELGFMPDELASGGQTIFWWQGNVTPPHDHDEWARLVKAFILHIRQRYGDAEVATWPVEVWNEPNLAVFWKDADLDAYLKLYKITSLAVREAFPQMRVGGPAICGVSNHDDWMRAFLDFCQEQELPLDFVTRHIYCAGDPKQVERYMYHPMRDVGDVLAELNATRRIIDSYPRFRGLELHITEFNTSYNPFCPVHDTNQNAVLIAQMLASFGDTSASYSYWTFGDVFEESGVPAAQFHGGFGMIANGCVPKPTLWTFAFFKKLTGDCVLRAPNMVVTRCGDSYRGVCWNLGRDAAQIGLSLPAADTRALITRVVDEEVCNPLKAWHDIGQPAYPTQAQMELLRQSAYPLTRTQTVQPTDGVMKLSLSLGANAVVYFELAGVDGQNDRGYDYSYYCVE